MPSPGVARPRRSAASPALLFAVACAIFAADPARSERFVVVGDVHGDLASFRQVLRAAQMLDDHDDWSGGATNLVQIGDLLDRGADARAVLDLAMRLESQAPAQGGSYAQLLGNHEVMNLVGDLRYVTPEIFATFAGERSRQRQRQAWTKYRDWLRRRAVRLGMQAPEVGSAERDEWLAAHPEGLVEHRELFAPDGVYGKWLRARPALLRDDETLFVHGGVAPEALGQSLAEIDGRIHQEIARFDELRAELVSRDLVLPFFDLREMVAAMRLEIAALDREAGQSAPSPDAAARRELAEGLLAWDTWSIFSAQGPLWYRGYSEWTDEEAAAQIPPLLEAFGVRRIVVGHTPQGTGRIRSRASGGLFLVDSGINTSYVVGGHPGALEIFDGTVSALYSDGGREVLQSGDETAPRPEEAEPAEVQSAPQAATARWLDRDGKPLPFADDEDLVAFLATAPVVEDKPIGEGVTRPHRLTLERDGVRIRAAFRTIDEEHRVYRTASGRMEVNFRDFYGFEPAAYRLGRLLGLREIPPATVRNFKNQDGSVQLWIENGKTERVRLDEEVRPADYMRWLRQIQMMRIWDELVGNTDRNKGNMVYGPDWHLWLIDHTRAFRNSDDLLEAEKITWCERGFFEKLRTTSDEAIRAALQDQVKPSEIQALLRRRKTLVSLLEDLIRDRGEGAVLFDWPK